MRTAAVVLAVLLLGGLLASLADRSGGRIFASPATPPAPPGSVPTPVGRPPLPPTPTATPTSTPVPLPTATPTSVPAISPTLATVPTKTLTGFTFSLDAARVSKPKNPGNLQGLASIKPGSKVWLMVYYTVRSLPTEATRTTTYEIRYASTTIYRVTYQNRESAGATGRFTRYTVYKAPSTLPYGHYVFRASLSLGKVAHHRSWKFNVGKQVRVAKALNAP